MPSIAKGSYNANMKEFFWVFLGKCAFHGISGIGKVKNEVCCRKKAIFFEKGGVVFETILPTPLHNPLPQLNL